MRKSLSLLILLALAGAAPVAAQEFWVGGTYGLTGDVDNGVDPDAGNENLAVFFAFESAPDLDLRFSAGAMDLHNGRGSHQQFPIEHAQITYGTASVSYRVYQGYFDSGMAIGIGAYREERDFFEDDARGFYDENESAFGASFGVNGIWKLTTRLSFIADLTAHYVAFDDRRILVTANGGLQVEF